jgi:putative endonuclease
MSESSRATAHQTSGRQGEQTALAFLEQQGLELVARNHRCRLGEIDLIMRDGHVLVFVEVRYRASTRFGSGAATITRRKQRRIILAARHFLAGLRARALPTCRFDVVSLSQRNYATPIEWIRDAFSEDG